MGPNTNSELLSFAKAIIESIQPTNECQLSDDVLLKLGFIFPENFILAALDLIDRENVIHYTTSWGHSEYEVLGSTATYSVFVDPQAACLHYSCTCPAFAYSVLLSETHIMCKHILATLIGRRLARCIQRPCKADDLAAIYCRQFPLAAKESIAITADDVTATIKLE